MPRVILAAAIALAACGHVPAQHQAESNSPHMNWPPSVPAPPQCANCGIEANPPPPKTYDPTATY